VLRPLPGALSRQRSRTAQLVGIGEVRALLEAGLRKLGAAGDSGSVSGILRSTFSQEQRMPQPPPKIPRQELRSGALKCFALAAKRLDEAAALLEAEFESQAAIVFSFAVEEVGKAVLLSQAYDLGRDPVEVGAFYLHAKKIDAAASVIPGQYLRLTTPEFDPDEFSAEFAIDFVPVDLEARLQALYVNWDANRQTWLEAVHVERGAILNSISGVRSTLDFLINDWWP
jgi:AbiV family abortive infection protein